MSTIPIPAPISGGLMLSRNSYVRKCDLCLDIRRHLSTQGDFEELQPKEYYQHVPTSQDTAPDQ